MANVDLTRYAIDPRSSSIERSSTIKTSADAGSHRKTNATRWKMFRDDYDNKANTRNNSPYLTWWVNPSECQWKVGTRTSIEKVGGGAIHHEWPQTGIGSNPSFTGSRFDQPVLSLSFQSGIITLGGYNDIFSGKDNSKDAPLGLGNYFDFLDILERSNEQDSGEPNYVNLLYSSPIFGSGGIWLKGFFDEGGVSWTDSAENPNQITSWGASLIVYNCSPKLAALRSCFQTLGMET